MEQKRVLGLLGLASVAGAYMYGASLEVIIFIAAMAFFQNVAYGLQSRARMRDSNLYHIIAMFLASGVFFATFRYLTINNLPLVLLPAYLVGTCYGTLKGNNLSQYIENKIGAKVGSIADKGSSQLVRFWPSLIFLVLLIIGQSLVGDYSLKIVLIIAGLSLIDSLGFSITTITRNANNYTIHYVATFIQVLVKFISLKILVEQQMTWYLLLPQMGGGAIGSIVGAEMAKGIVKKFGASFDGHLNKAGKIYIALPEILFTTLFILPQFYFFGFETIAPVAVLLFAATAQSISFTNVSRARQRKNENYLLWASIFSNGVWYLTAHLLVVKVLPMYMLIPYTMGTLYGGMIGQFVSMQIERMFKIKTE
ncbi:MAG: hypothetical protein UW46_C0011G0028 [Candidatus Yanofskybacteria bacterium GW2011_GWF1_44_227]|uniref:Uncharacterized protein n=1 Tax=Candidatus Yanofskybacteria bacterium GW2011_GWE2_40_11 TaxID=1619033 RepID=A0A0G0QK74_9BACT|nr:MAG: hypothetical protein UT69_C0007G0027 [Candidatus Yanofskybacteria bacterium GW2011_GWE1_40_10]KKR40538.1 MAG: hypothetical protein UT75_C0008G0060 [Candidatus Yanofskybacteria bacterium GW2011_GWE2_40_11]KKT15161.1 MAG: hypothetical protein UV97_C0011G0001 [Candidatus Yanofskybacteria bacterium GW2011_GWF2_43_596]KKT52806.1 MAG: hypothetical protein UW46_C0011G0028 [Candidatus Yanofskybacteria bacterium GW2011_GWF1_44_227]OGN35463.1 MAG: hypothetical protein A2207_01840 [Candidatus Yano